MLYFITCKKSLFHKIFRIDEELHAVGTDWQTITQGNFFFHSVNFLFGTVDLLFGTVDLVIRDLGSVFRD